MRGLTMKGKKRRGKSELPTASARIEELYSGGP